MSPLRPTDRPQVRPREWRSSGVAAVAVAVLAALPPLWRAVAVAAGRARPVGDVRVVWAGVADAVLRGAPLYAALPAADNKPPGFLLAVVVARSLDALPLAVLGSVALGNAVVVAAVYVLGVRATGDAPASLLGATLAAVALVRVGTVGQNKSLTAALATLALVVGSPAVAGVALGAAASTVQFGALVVPAVVYRVWHRRGPRAVGTALAAAAAAVVAPFLVVGAVWGIEALLGVPPPADAAAGDAPRSLVSAPGVWLSVAAEAVSRIHFLLVAAAAGVVAVATDRSDLPAGGRRSRRTVALYGACAGTALVVRAWLHYWVLLVPALGVAAAVGIAAGRDALRR